MRNSTNPMANKTAIMPTPVLMLPENWLMALTRVVPKKAAPLPQMSIRPKYSPDCSGVMILVK